MAKDKAYTGKDIVSLSDRDHVRLRTQIYLGNMNRTTYTIPLLSSDKGLELKDVEFVPAAYKAIGEIIDNSLDEFAQISSKIKLLKIDAEPSIGAYTIADNGRGIPVESKKEGNKDVWVPELALAHLRAGRNFRDDKEIGVIGQNGVGTACTNFCSSDFEVRIHRDNQRYTQKFTDGASKISRPKVSSNGAKTGTEIFFQLDPTVFKNGVDMPEELLRNRAIEIAMTNPDVTVEFNGERFRFKKGMADIVANMTTSTSYGFTINTTSVEGEVYLLPDAHKGLDEIMFTWVNSSMLFDGGKCNTQFFNALFDRVIAHLEKRAKAEKSEVTRNDVRQGLLVLANLRIKNPEYDSQAKTRLTGPDIRKELNAMFDEHWKSFSKKCDDWLSVVLTRAVERHHYQANKDAIEEHERHKSRRVDGLLDATGSTRSLCQILIAEGDSAQGQISEARDPRTTAAFALTGKINNVYGATPAQVLKMGKLTDLLSAIGLTPGKKAVRSNLNYGRIVIATDADYDGDDIFTLLTNLFYQFWPELFHKDYQPMVFRLVAPNVVVSKGKQRIHFPKRVDFEKVKDKYKGWTVEYMKGLGAMWQEDWEMVLSGKTDTLVPIVDDGKIGETLTLLFGDSADARKEWLTKMTQ